MPDFEIGTINQQSADAYRGMGRAFLITGIALVAESVGFATVGFWTGNWRLLSVDYGAVVLLPGCMGAFCLVLYALRSGAPPTMISVEPHVIVLRWSSGRSRVVRWGGDGTKLSLLDSSRVPSYRRAMRRNGWYRIMMPRTRLTYTLSEEAFYEIIRQANQLGCRMERKSVSPYLAGFAERVLILPPPGPSSLQ